MDQRYEGMAVSLVRPGLQCRLAVVLYGKSFSTLSMLEKYGRLAGHLKLSLLVRAKVRWCGPAVCQELGVSAGSPGRFWKDGFLPWPIATLLSHWLTNWQYRVHTSANLASG